MQGEHTLFVPDLFYGEIANILWKRVRFNELEEGVARNILLSLHTFVLGVDSCADLSKGALEIAIPAECAVYDAIYITQAIKRDAVLVTADAKLYNMVKDTSLGKYVVLLGEGSLG